MALADPAEDRFKKAAFLHGEDLPKLYGPYKLLKALSPNRLLLHGVPPLGDDKDKKTEERDFEVGLRGIKGDTGNKAVDKDAAEWLYARVHTAGEIELDDMLWLRKDSVVVGKEGTLSAFVYRANQCSVTKDEKGAKKIAILVLFMLQLDQLEVGHLLPDLDDKDNPEYAVFVETMNRAKANQFGYWKPGQPWSTDKGKRNP